MRPNWHHGQHPPACTCADCERNRRVGGGPISAIPQEPGGGQKEIRIHRECEAYIARVCRRFSIHIPIFILSDTMQNPGACGEAGKLVVRMQRHFTLNASRQDREAVIRHELAHISVHNTLGDVEPHGPEFQRELNRLGGDRMSGRVVNVEDAESTVSTFVHLRRTLGVIILGFLAFVFFQSWLFQVLPDWLTAYLAIVTHFLGIIYLKWPLWTAMSGLTLGVAGAILLADWD